MLAIDDQFDGGGNGGSLNISFNEAPPPPTVDISVNRLGKFNSRTGVATISGTYTCDNADFIDVFVDARQNVGRGSPSWVLVFSSTPTRAMESPAPGPLTSSPTTASSLAERR